MKSCIILFLSLFSASINAKLAMTCESDYRQANENGYFKEFHCKNGIVTETKEYKNNYSTLMTHVLFDTEGRPVSHKGWSTEGRFTFFETYQYLDENTFIKNNFNTYLLKPVLRRSEFYRDKKLFKECEYRIEPNVIDICTLFNEQGKQNGVIEFSNLGKAMYRYEFLKFSQTNENHLQAFNIYDVNDKLVGHFDERKQFNPIEEIKSQFSGDKLQRKLDIYLSEKIPVAILDTGFDVTHPSLTYKLYRNPNEPVDGVDNDGNGWIDDYMGWHRTSEVVLNLEVSRNNIQELVYLPQGNIPSSHGTHVAGIALKDVNKFGLIGYAGDMSDVQLLKNAARNLSELNIEFMNLSLAYGGYRDPFAPGRESFDALEELIERNSHTLFFVAASNGDPGLNLDIARNRTYPASFEFENMLVVGALNTDEIIPTKLSSYKMADFSYYGDETVDIFAPGENVKGPRLGGGTVKFSGTSMATPYVMNIGLKAKELAPRLSSMQIKKIIMQTAFIPTPRLKCKSGGIIYPARVLEVARRYSKNYKITLEKIIADVTKSIY